MHSPTENPLENLQEVIGSNTAVLAYFSHDKCSVCKVLKPKIKELLNERFPGMKMVYINTERQPTEAASCQIFTVPAILVFFEGKEYYRYSRNVSLETLANDIARPYNMLF
ncbi:thioredoxin [Marinilabiliaceae bacterium JC017]|nr:thioredoxin [Marinilabiliaceae bacterium JC017]